MLGTGMDIGELNEYSHQICLYLILKIFRREITENPNRTKSDIVKMCEDVISQMKLTASLQICQRIVNGLLSYKDPSRQEPFSANIFNEQSGKYEIFKFRYLKIDREHSDFQRNSNFVYMLTEQAQEIIFITREILEEFGFDIEQFYTLQLIKSGNFNKAQSSITNLIGRVQVLVRREKDYRQDIIRDPQLIFKSGRKNRGINENDIKKQFEDEQKIFEDMFSWKERLSSFPKDKLIDAENVFESLERAKKLHDDLAAIVVDNMAYEVELRVKHPESFWNTSDISFKKEIWKNNIVKNGLTSMDLFYDILTPLFSADIEFIFPLDWAWSEQSVRKTREINYIEDDEEYEKGYKNETDWENILAVWSKVFDQLIEKREFSIGMLSTSSESIKYEWLKQKKNIDFFMMFVITPLRLTLEYGMEDERLELYQRLCDMDKKYMQLEGCRIMSINEPEKKPLEWDEIYISAYKLFIEEDEKNGY